MLECVSSSFGSPCDESIRSRVGVTCCLCSGVVFTIGGSLSVEGGGGRKDGTKTVILDCGKVSFAFCSLTVKIKPEIEYIERGHSEWTVSVGMFTNNRVGRVICSSEQRAATRAPGADSDTRSSRDREL